MANNRLTGACAHHLNIMQTPNSRSDDVQESQMRSATPQSRLPSFSNFIRPIPNVSPSNRQAMDLDQPAGVPENLALIRLPDREDHGNSRFVGVQGNKGVSVNNYKSCDLRGGPSSMVERGSSTQVRFDNGDVASTTLVPVDEVQVAKPRGSSSTDTSLYPSNPSSSDQDVHMIDTLIHDIAEAQPSELAQGYSTPPLYAISDAGSNAPEVQETWTKVKKSTEKMQGSLKKALGRALVRRNRNSSQHNGEIRGSTHAPPPGNDIASSMVDPRTQEAPRDSSNPAFYPQDLPRRRLLGEASRIARHTVRLARTSFGHREPRSDAAKEGKLQITPSDPVLAASLDTMAREYATSNKGSPAHSSAFKKLTGKRHRDNDHLLRSVELPSVCSGDKPGFIFGKQGSQTKGRPDTPRCTTVCQSDDAMEIRAVEDGSRAHPKSRKGQFNGGPSTNAGNLLAPDHKCQNDLDFLASVVLSQEFPDHKQGMDAKIRGRPNRSSSISNQGVMNQCDVNVVQSDPAPQAMPVDKLLGNNVNGTQINAVNSSDQASTHLAQGDDQQVTHLGVTTITNNEGSAYHIALGGQNVSQPSPNYNEEPKSEASYVDEESPASRPQKMQVQPAFHNSAQHMTEESAPHVEDEITPATQESSRLVHLDGISPVRQVSSCQFQEVEEIVPATQPLSPGRDSSQATPTMTHQGSSSNEIAKCKSLIPPYVPEDQAPVGPLAPGGHQSPGPGTSLIQGLFSQAPKPSFHRILEKGMVGAAAPVPQHLQTRGTSAGPSSSGPGGSSHDGKRPVRRTIDEDVSEITPAPPRPQRSGTSQAGPSSQNPSLTNGAGSSAQGATQGAASRARSSRSRSRSRSTTTTLPYTFGCDVCGAMFNRRFNLNKHIRNVHHNIRKFKCSMCEERFLQKSHRAAHLLAVHHKLRPFACHLCGKNFSWLGVLRKHLQAIHKVPIQTTKRARRTRNTKIGKKQQAPDKVQPLSSRAPKAPAASSPSSMTSPTTPPSHGKRRSK